MKLTREQEKETRERNIFREFVYKSELPIDPGSIESQKCPQPDILCSHHQDGFIAFELFEFCSEDIAIAVTKLKKDKKDHVIIRTASPSKKLKEKLKKEYQTNYPIELLCYTNGRTCEPDDVLLENMRPIIDMNNGQFRRIWLFGNKCHIAWQAIQK
ncbi:MAG: hypothetical protein K8R48_06230 [Alphaproteobacteria bacterium]|nr:hypothetical protein [Alphaproteobacteria bacterium]